MSNNMKRVLLTVVSALLLVVMSVGATLAYLTSTTGTVSNTFTVGNVEIKLDEAALNDYNPTSNEYTAKADGSRTMTNTYHMVPGVKMAKDPTVTVKANSEDCYVRALVTITYRAAADTVIPADFWSGPNGDWIQGYNNGIWVIYPDGYSVTKYTETVGEGDDAEEIDMVQRTYELRYYTQVSKATTDTKLTPIFTSIKLPDDLTNNQIEALTGLQIDVVAHAIQTQGFATPDDAWEVWADASKDSQ